MQNTMKKQAKLTSVKNLKYFETRPDHKEINACRIRIGNDQNEIKQSGIYQIINLYPNILIVESLFVCFHVFLFVDIYLRTFIGNTTTVFPLLSEMIGEMVGYVEHQWVSTVHYR